VDRPRAHVDKVWGSCDAYCKFLYGLYPDESTAPKTQVVHSLILYGLYPDVHAAGYGLYPDESTCPKTKVVRTTTHTHKEGGRERVYCKFLYGLYPNESTAPKTKVVRSLIRRVRWDTALDGIPLRPVPR